MPPFQTKKRVGYMRYFGIKDENETKIYIFNILALRIPVNIKVEMYLLYHWTNATFLRVSWPIQN